MKNKSIGIFLFVIVVTVVILVIRDFTSSRPGKRNPNPYEFSMDEYSKVDKELIKYEEKKQIKLNCEKPHAIEIGDGKIFLLADDYLQIINESGTELLKKNIGKEAQCIRVAGENIIIGYKNYIAVLNSMGEVLKQSSPENEKSVFTSVAIKDDKIYVADAGMRRILIFNTEAVKTGEFEGESGTSVLHGFIIPSPYFDIAINNENELWVVNPGMHSLQNYEDDGSLLNYWEKTSPEIDGFSGCCNPAHFDFLPDGDFVTSEKGLVRIKVYDKSGVLKSVVAPPEKFKDGTIAPDVSVDLVGNIYALDYDKKMVRIFTQK